MREDEWRYLILIGDIVDQLLSILDLTSPGL